MKRLRYVGLAMFSVALQGAQEPEQAPVPDEQPDKMQQQEPQAREFDVKLVPPECAPKDLNTVDVQAGGNWVVKRAFWEAAVSTYDAIVQLNDQLYSLQMTYINQRNEANKQVDKSFIELGFDRGELFQLASSLIADFEREKEIHGDLSLDVREQINKVKQQLKQIEKLQADLEAVEKIEAALDEVLVQVVRTINQCREFEKKAWENYKLIGLELNDKRARDLFYQMEGFQQSIQKNIDYLKKELKNYFAESIEREQKALESIAQNAEAIKATGVDLQAEYEKHFKKDVSELRNEAAQASLDEEEVKRLMEEKKKLEAQIEKDRAAQASWVTRALNMVGGALASVKSFFGTMWQKIAFWSKK